MENTTQIQVKRNSSRQEGLPMTLKGILCNKSYITASNAILNLSMKTFILRRQNTMQEILKELMKNKKYLYVLILRKHNKYTFSDPSFIVTFFNANFFLSQFWSTYTEMKVTGTFNVQIVYLVLIFVPPPSLILSFLSC